MSDYTKKEVELFGKKQTFRALSGVVLKQQQRSDTYVSGSGSSSSVGGSGSGHTTIRTTVVITTDIWIRGLSGQEYRLDFEQDIPAREGNVIHAIDVLDSSDIKVSNGYVLLYNSTTGEWFHTGGLNATVRNISVAKNMRRIISVVTLSGCIVGFVWALVIFNTDFRPEFSIFPKVIFSLGFLGFIVGFIVAAIYHSMVAGNLPKARKELSDNFQESFIAELDQVAKNFTETKSESKTVELPKVIAPESVLSEHQKLLPVFCTQCGTGIAENAAFCGSCGTKLAVAV